MKAKLFTVAVLSVSALTLIKTDVFRMNEHSMSGELLACAWFPVCGDPDIYNPVLTPNDSKTSTDTKGTKNEKLA